MARMINYGDDELLANPFAFAAQAPVAPAMLAPVSAPVAAAQAPTAREMMDGVGKDGQVPALSMTQGYGMVPVYQAQQGRGPDRGPPVLMGYEFNPYEAGLTTVDTPKPAAILAEEKRLGKEMEPTYATYTAPRKGPGGGGGESVAYGPPTGYRYDNGQSQYVKFDASGNYYETEKRKSGFEDALPLLAIMSLPFLGPLAFEALGLTGAGTAGGLLGAGEIAALPASQLASLGSAAAPLAFTPEMIAAGAFTPGSIGAAGAASGALTAGQLAAAYGVPGLLTELAPLAAIPETVTQTIPEAITQTVPQTVAPSINEMVASGTFTPGSAGAAGAASGALTGAELAAAGGLVTAGATPALVEMAAQGAQNYLESGGGAQAGAGGGPNGTDIFREISVNQGVASGLGPGSMGADMAAKGLLTAEQLAAAAGITGAGTGLLSSASSSLPSLSTIKDALTVASLVSGAVGNNNASTTAPFTMAPYVPPSGKPFANIAMSPIATPYTPTRILGQYDPTMTPGGVSPYELIMQQMQAPKNLYADFEAGTNIGGYDPQRFVVPPAAAAAALPNNMGGMIDKSRMVGPNPMGPDNGFASIQDGEFVMNRKATQKYGIELMNAINSGKISKGKLSGLLEA